ncbi:hypothetical protein M9H77_27148 [Catharanthus roseus]|uniref:Uncharacterized protein n=1 Tax=Catharanthus roseus TaxID=4058 RepID=A0ACC0ADK0_CATRO|nr:hypothetical protein M9H77_27148 [Catharanthus roseus]
MTRKKVKLAFITNDSARKATYKKRKKGLMKKVSELSTLCGIDACAIIYSPYDSQPEVWPNTSGVQRVIAQYKRMPEMEQSKKMVNQETFIKQRIAKANEQLKKQHKDNREKEITEIMYQSLTGKGLQNLTLSDLTDLGWMIDQKLKEIYKRIESIKKNVSHPQQVAPAVAVVEPLRQPPASAVVARGNQGQEQKTVPHWFGDWMNSSNENIGFGHGEEMMMPFNDNSQTTMWTSAFFQN